MAAKRTSCESRTGGRTARKAAADAVTGKSAWVETATAAAHAEAAASTAHVEATAATAHMDAATAAAHVDAAAAAATTAMESATTAAAAREALLTPRPAASELQQPRWQEARRQFWMIWRGDVFWRWDEMTWHKLTWRELPAVLPPAPANRTLAWPKSFWRHQ